MAESTPGGAATVAAPGPMPGFPEGVDPETYKVEEVTDLLKRAAYLSIFSVPDPQTKNERVPINPLLPFLLAGVNVHESLHRFDVQMQPPAAGRGLRAANRTGEPMARVSIRWRVIPERFEAGPGREPPSTILNPMASQRFCMLDGHMSYLDAPGSGFRGFGCGRTFPCEEGGKKRLNVGAVVEVLEGFGRFAGLQGVFCINGFIDPPDHLALNMIGRFMDPEGTLAATGPLDELVPVEDGDPSSVFLSLLGEVDRDHPVSLVHDAEGHVIGSRVFERLRLVHVGADLDGGKGVRSRVEEGPLVGTVTAQLFFNPLDPRPVAPIRTTAGVFTFVDGDGKVLGSVDADMVEGRAFRTPLAGAPTPVFRFAGVGPITGGSGAFAGAVGMMSMNSAISVFPRTLSNLYVLRLHDPDGRYRAAYLRDFALAPLPGKKEGKEKPAARAKG
jgi:hypothetical protein